MSSIGIVLQSMDNSSFWLWVDNTAQDVSGADERWWDEHADDVTELIRRSSKRTPRATWAALRILERHPSLLHGPPFHSELGLAVLMHLHLAVGRKEAHAAELRSHIVRNGSHLMLSALTDYLRFVYFHMWASFDHDMLRLAFRVSQATVHHKDTFAKWILELTFASCAIICRRCQFGPVRLLFKCLDIVESGTTIDVMDVDAAVATARANFAVYAERLGNVTEAELWESWHIVLSVCEDRSELIRTIMCHAGVTKVEVPKLHSDPYLDVFDWQINV